MAGRRRRAGRHPNMAGRRRRAGRHPDRAGRRRRTGRYPARAGRQRCTGRYPARAGRWRDDGWQCTAGGKHVDRYRRRRGKCSRHSNRSCRSRAGRGSDRANREWGHRTARPFLYRTFDQNMAGRSGSKCALPADRLPAFLWQMQKESVSDHRFPAA